MSAGYGLRLTSGHASESGLAPLDEIDPDCASFRPSRSSGEPGGQETKAADAITPCAVGCTTGYNEACLWRNRGDTESAQIDSRVGLPKIRTTPRLAAQLLRLLIQFSALCSQLPRPTALPMGVRFSCP